ncbi:Meiotic recombination protein SPO11-2 [Linum perenne]
MDEDLDLCRSSMAFFSAQQLCYADILPAHEEPNQEIVDCSECGSSGYSISGDLDLLDRLTMRTDARYIIVVEKHAIFQRLAEDRIFNHIPSILITAKGYPDMATRYISSACNVRWLGVRGDDLQFIPEESLVPLKPRDIQIAKSLMSSEILQDKYKEELELMVQSGKRAEIEALFFHGYDFLGKYIAKKIVQANYI